MQTIGYNATHIGRRERNEDYSLVNDALGLYIVCDGMGGHAAGHIASRIAAETAATFIRANEGVLQAVRRGELTLRAAQYLVEDAIQTASEAVYTAAARDAWLQGMGTTLTLLLLVDEHAVMGHVGDSRLYRVRGRDVKRISRDHTMAEELARAGLWTPERAATSRLNHVLTRSVGVDLEGPQIDTEVIRLQAGDLFLLCSDGLNTCLEYDRCGSHKRLFAGPLELLAEDLVNLAVQSGASDNTTAVVISIEEDETLDYTYDLRAVS